MNKMKDDAQKNRQLELQRDKEINQLRKSQRMKDNQIKTMEAERKQKEIVLKRKQEEVILFFFVFSHISLISRSFNAFSIFVSGGIIEKEESTRNVC